MSFLKHLKSIFPLIIGILIGSGLTKNKSVWIILIVVIIMSWVFKLFSRSAVKIKDSADKKIAVQNELTESLNSAIDYTEAGHSLGASMFDRFYSGYIFVFNLLLVVFVFIFLIKGAWLWSLVCFLGLNIFIILNQIVRKVKHLDNSEYVKKDSTEYVKGGKID